MNNNKKGDNMKIVKRISQALALMAITLTVASIFAYGLSCVTPYVEKVPTSIIYILIFVGLFVVAYTEVVNSEKEITDYGTLYYKRKCEYLQYENNTFKKAIETLEDEDIKKYLLSKIKEDD